MAVFRKFKGLHINCGHRDPQKAHPWPKRRLLAYFSLKNPFRGVGCSELQEPKKALKTSPHGTENHVYREQNPLKGARYNLAC